MRSPRDFLLFVLVATHSVVTAANSAQQQRGHCSSGGALLFRFFHHRSLSLNDEEPIAQPAALPLCCCADRYHKPESAPRVSPRLGARAPQIQHRTWDHHRSYSCRLF